MPSSVPCCRHGTFFIFLWKVQVTSFHPIDCNFELCPDMNWHVFKFGMFTRHHFTTHLAVYLRLASNFFVASFLIIRGRCTSVDGRLSAVHSTSIGLLSIFLQQTWACFPSVLLFSSCLALHTHALLLSLTLSPVLAHFFAPHSIALDPYK